MKVPRLGPKAFEQAAGFLRIRDGENPLDGSAVHPERYGIVDRMASDLGCAVEDLIENEQVHRKIELEKYVDGEVGLPTLQDIVEELARPGRDPREAFEQFAFAEGVEKLEYLAAGMKLPGIITNVTAFGAFVDIGVHQDGLVHISQLADRYVRDPNEVARVHQKVEVRVLDVDLDRRRIALSLKKEIDPEQRQQKEAGRRERDTADNSGNRGQRSQGNEGKRKPQPRRREEKPQTAMGEALRKLGLG